MKSIHVEDIRSYYAKTHVTQNMRFILAGNLAGRQKKIEEVFGSFELGSGIRFELPEEDAKPYDDVFYIEKPDLKNMYFFLSTFSNRVLSELEEDALHLVNTMLTGTLHSRILGEAREQGLAYDISSSFNRFKRATGWWFGAELTEVNTDKVFEIIRTELKRLLDGKVDDADVTAAQQFSLGRYQRSAQTVRGLANGYSSAYFFDEHIEDYFAYPDRIAAVTKADMLGVVSTMFKDEIWGLAIMGTDVARRSESLNEQIAALWQSQK
jgi:predicted Zn-dependent peptidase